MRGLGEQKEKISFSFFYFSFSVRGREERKRASKLLSSIIGVPSIGIHRESSSTQQGLQIHTKNEGFHKKSKGRNFGVGRLPTSATTLQEVGTLSTLVYFHPKGLISWKM